MSSSSRRQRTAAALLTLAQVGQAQWFFGNLYEAVVKVPDRLAGQRDLAVPAGQPVTVRAIMRAGSPVRYYLPAGPTAAGAAMAALVAGWDGSSSRRWLAASAVASLSGAALTTCIVSEVNISLFFASDPPTAAERAALLRRWHRVNMIRLAVAAAAWATAQRAKSGTQ